MIAALLAFLARHFCDARETASCQSTDHLVMATKFCSSCGARLLKQCPRCGNRVIVGDLFCDGCGMRLNQDREAS